MKKLFYFLCAASLLMTACDSNKDENNGPEAPKDKLVKSMTYYEGNGTGTLSEYSYNEFEYDNQSRIVKVKYKDTEDGASAESVTAMTVVYSGNQIIITRTDEDGGVTETDVTKLTMNNGVATSMHTTWTSSNGDEPEVENHTLTYSGGYLTQVKEQGENYTSTDDLTWSGGNVVATKNTFSDEGTGNVYIYTTQVEYGTVERKGNLDFNYWLGGEFYVFVGSLSDGNMFGWFGKQNANLMSKSSEQHEGSSSTNIETFEYKYDADGYVTQILCKRNGTIDSKFIIGY